MTKNDSKVRYDWVDTLKFLGILFIYIGHYGDAAGLFYKYVFQFHVPLFFFISGFFFKNKTSENLINFAIKNFKKYMIPYFLLNILYIVVCCSLNNYGIAFILKNMVKMVLGIRNDLISNSPWFITCLFSLEMIYFVLNKIFRGNKYILCILSFVLYVFFTFLMPFNPIIKPSWFWNIDSAFVYLIYYSLGNLLFAYIKNLKSLYSSNKIVCVCFFSIVCLINTICFFKGREIIGLFLIGKYYFLYDIFFTLILIFFWIVVSFCISDCKIFSSIGKDTLYLCLTENLIKVLLVNFLLVFGITINLSNSFVVIVYCVIIIIFNSKFLIPFLKKIGLFSCKKIKEMVIL